MLSHDMVKNETATHEQTESFLPVSAVAIMMHPELRNRKSQKNGQFSRLSDSAHKIPGEQNLILP
jgi:hypothetical protein